MCDTGMTGPVVIDYKGDRIMDYQVWYLASDSDKFKGYMKIPLTLAGRNTTACVEWLVKRHTPYPEKRDQNVFCNISYKTRAIVMKFGI